MDWRLLVPFSNLIVLVLSAYQPLGDEVLAGSVLLPATRRGRYLANIIKRQAVDGTGISFNKNADRMNAEAKKKVDVLSDDLLPYIIGEQERRTTLHMRVMTAIQNGEKGVTIAEIRNKPPLFIRKGLMYRCPSDLGVLEPDGSGLMMCEKDIVPSLITYDSCLSAEDRDLYTTGNKYFFCNRHRVEGPDLPKNGSAVIACAPAERTSLNYTYAKCALEDSEDVVVHYRYYPDRTYKFVDELDPDHEVCDHWRPCQIGYIFSLPTPDQASPVHELWRYPVPDDDFLEEYINRKGTLDGEPYIPSPRRVKLDSVAQDSIIKVFIYKTNDPNPGYKPYLPPMKHKTPPYFYVTNLTIPNKDKYPTSRFHIGAIKIDEDGHGQHKMHPEFLIIKRTDVEVQEVKLQLEVGKEGGVHKIHFKGPGHRATHVRVRAANWRVYNLSPSVCKISHDSEGGTLEINLGTVTQDIFGHYFAMINAPDGEEQKVRIMQVSKLEPAVVRKQFGVGEPAQFKVQYTCAECEVSDVLCNGESVWAREQVKPEPPDTVTFNFQSYEDTDSCTYKAVIEKKDRATPELVLAVLENITIPQFEKVDAPPTGSTFEITIPHQCHKNCNVVKVFANGIPLLSVSNKDMDDNSTTDPAVFDASTPSKITIRIPDFKADYEGVYQAVFKMDYGFNITKNILEVKNKETRRLTEDSDKNYDADITNDLDIGISTAKDVIESSTHGTSATSETGSAGVSLTSDSSAYTVTTDTSTNPTVSEEATTISENTSINLATETVVTTLPSTSR